MKRLLIAVLFFVALTPAFADDNDYLLTAGCLNGRGWSALDESSKAMYVRGIYDGMQLLSLFDQDPELKIIRRLNDAAVLVGVPLKEIAQAVDLFYADSLNRRIPVYAAPTWAKLKSGGATAAQLEPVASSLRALFNPERAK